MPNQEELLRQVQQRLDKKYSALDPAVYGRTTGLGSSLGRSSFQQFTPQEVEYADRYGVALTPGEDLNEALYQAQGQGDMVLKGLERLAKSTLYKTFSGAGYLGSMVLNIGEEDYLASVASNGASELLNGWEEEMKEDNPIFKNKAYHDGTLFQKLTNAAFWTDDVVDGLAFMASTWGPGAGIKGVMVGQKLASKTAQVMGKYSGLAAKAEQGAFATANIQKWGQKLDQVTQGALMTSMEAFAEANGVKEEMERKAASKYQAGEINMAQYMEELENAKSGAAQAYTLNMALIGPSNFVEAGMINKIGRKFSDARELKRMNKLKEENPALKDIIDPSSPSFRQDNAIDGLTTNKLGDASFTAQSAKKAMLKEAGKQGLAEGLYEENIQFSIEEVASETSAEDRGKGMFMQTVGNIGQVLGRTINVPEYSQDRLMAITLGSLLGSGGGALAGRSETNRNNKKGERMAQAIVDSYKNYASTDVYQRDEAGNLVLDPETNQPVIDPAKQAAVSERVKTLGHMAHVLDDLETSEKDQAIIDYARGRAFNSLAQSYFHAGKYQEFMEMVNSSEEVDPRLKKHAAKLKDLYETQSTGLLRDASTQARQIKLQEIGGEILFLNDLIGDRLKAIQDKEASITEMLEADPIQQQYRELLGAKKELEFKIKSLERVKPFGTYGLPNKPKVGDVYPGNISPSGEVTSFLSWDEIIKTPSVGVVKAEIKAILEKTNEQLAELSKELEEAGKSKAELDMLAKSGQKDLDLLRLQKAELELTRFVRGKQYENLSTPKGAKAYAEALVRIEEAMDPSSFKLETSTPESYDRFEEAVIGAMRYGLNKANINRKYAGEPLIKAAQEGNMEPVIEALRDPNLALSPEDAQTLKSLIKQYIQSTQEEVDEDSGITINSREGDILESLLPNLDNQKFDEVTDEVIRVKIAEGFTRLAKEVIQNYEGSSDYSNVAEGERQLGVLEKLLQVVENKTSEGFPEFIRDLRNMITRLKDEIIPKLKERQADREAQIGRIVGQHTREAFLSLGINMDGSLTEVGRVIRDSLEDGVLDGLIQDALANNMSTIYPLTIYSLINKAPADKKARVLDALEIEKKRLLAAFEPLTKLGILEHMTVESSNFAEDPVQYLKYAMKFIADRKEGNPDAAKDSAVSKYMTSYDLARFKEDLKSRPDGTYKTSDLIKLIDLYEQISGIEHTLPFLNGEGLIIDQILNEISVARNTANLTTPSEEQLSVIREINAFLMSVPSKELFGPVAYLSGFAGTGKTNLIVRWIKALKGYTDEDIYACSPTDKASQELNASLGKAGSSDSFENLLRALDAPLTFKPQIIIVDEVTRLAQNKIGILAEKVQALNSARVAAKQPEVKVVFLGDPNQLQEDFSASAPILDNAARTQDVPGINNVTVIRALSTRFRSNVPAVNDFQDLFISELSDMSKKPLIAKCTSADPTKDKEVSFGVFGLIDPLNQVKDWITNQNLVDGKRRLIITSESKKAAYEAVVQGTNVEVLTVYEAQGLTREQVFIDIPQGQSVSDHNQILYTAISRGTELIMIANHNISNVRDVSMIDIIKTREADNAARKEAFITKRVEEYEKISKYFEGYAPEGAADVARGSTAGSVKDRADVEAALMGTGKPAPPPGPAGPASPAGPAPTSGGPSSAPASSSSAPSASPGDPISDDVYNDFIDHNKVPNAVLESIAQKVINRETLSPREQAIFNGKTTEINGIIAMKYASTVPTAEEEEAETQQEAELGEEEHTEVIDPERSDEIINDGEEVDPLELEPAPTTPSGGSITLTYVNSNNLRKTFILPGGQTQEHPGFGAGDEVIFVKSGDKLVALALNNGNYYEVGVLSEEELNNQPELKEAYLNTREAIKESARIGAIDPARIDMTYVLGTARIESSVPTQYNFGEKKPVTAETLMEAVVKVVKSVVRGVGKSGENISHAVDYATQNAKTVVFSNRTLESFISKTAQYNLKSVIKPGRVYLMIPVKTGPSAKTFWQAVQLPRKPFDKTDPSNQQKYLKPLAQFREQAKIIQEELEAFFGIQGMGIGALSQPSINEFVRRVGKGDLTGAVNVFFSEYGFNDAQYVDVEKAMGKTKEQIKALTYKEVISPKLYEACKAAYELVETPKNPKTGTIQAGEKVRNHVTPQKEIRNGRESLITFGVVESTTGDMAKVKYVQRDGTEVIVESPISDLYRYYSSKELTTGEAQRAINLLGMSNLMFNGVVIRAAQKGTGEAAGKNIMRGKSLLYYSNKPGQNLMTKEGKPAVLVQAENAAERFALTDPERGQRYLEQVQKEGNLTNMIGIEQLDQILEGTSEFTNWEPVPVQRKTDSGNTVSMHANTLESGDSSNIMSTPEGIEVLASYVDINLDSVRPTSVRISQPIIGTPAASPKSSTRSRARGSGRTGSAKLKDSNSLAFPTLISVKKAEKFLKKLFPNFNPETDLQVVAQSILMRLTEGKQAWGYFKKGVIYLEDNAQGIYEEVLKHEAIHRVWAYHLTPQERERINARLGEDAQEKLANAYMEYESGKRTELWLARILRKIRQFLGWYDRNFDTLDEFFDKLEKGEFVELTPEIEESLTGAPLLKIIEDFGDPQNFVELRNELAAYIDRFTIFDRVSSSEDRQDFYTREQARDIMKEDLLELEYSSPSNPNPNPDAERVSDDMYRAIMHYREVVAKQAQEQAADPKKAKKADLIDKLFKHFYNKSTYAKSTFDEEGEVKDTAQGGELSADEDQQAEIDENGNAVDPSDDKANLRDHIEEADVVDRYKKLFKSAKDFVGTIFVEDRGSIKLISPQSAFIILAEKLSNISSKPGEVIQDIRAQFAINPTIRSKAVMEKLEWIYQLSSKEFVRVNGKDYSLLNEEGELAAGNMIYSSIKEEQPDVYTSPAGVRIARRNDQSNLQWFEEIEERTGIPFDVIKALYQKEKAVDMFNSLVTGAGSLRKKNPYMVTEGKPNFVEVEGGVYIPVKVSKYISLQRQTSKLVIKNQLETALDIASVEQLTAAIAVLERSATTGREDSDNLEKLEEVLGKKHLNLIPLTSAKLGAPKSPINYIRDLSAILRDIRDLKKADPTKLASNNAYLTENPDTGVKRLVSITERIKDQHQSRVAEIQELLSTVGTSYEENTSYRSDGKTKWMYTLTTQAHEIISKLINTVSTIKGFNTEFAETSFYKLNPFFHAQQNVKFGDNVSTRKLNMYSIVDHDSIEKMNFNLLYKEEGFMQVLERTMFNGFMPNASLGFSGGKRRYFQFTMVNSNKPETRAVEVDMLKTPEVDGWLRHALIQEAARPRFARSYKNYTPEISNFPIMKDGKMIYPNVVDVTNEQALMERVAQIKEVLDQQAEVAVNAMIAQRAVVPGNFADDIQSLVKSGFLEASEAYKVLQDEKAWAKINSNKFYGLTPELLLPYAKLFFYNNAVNGYYINQTTFGDEAFTKNSYNVIKRMSIAWATGYRGRVDDKYGVPRKFKTIAIEDVTEKFDEILANLLKDDTFKKLVGEEFNRTDAQGFVTTKFANQLRKGYSRGMQLGSVLKPVHYQRDKYGIPRAIKYSAIELTEELQAAFPELRALAQVLERNDIAQAVFNSAIKIGTPTGSSVAQWSDLVAGKLNESVEQIELSGDYFRIQLNPRHELDSHVTQPSQLLYFLVSDPYNWDKALSVYTKIADMQGYKDRQTSEHFALRGNRAGGKGMIGEARKRVKRFIVQTLESSPHTVSQAEMLGSSKISLNFPTVSQIAQFMFNSAIASRVVQISYSGTKMVLQSDIGTNKVDASSYIVDENGEPISEDLLGMPTTKVYKDGREVTNKELEGLTQEQFKTGGYAIEAYVPYGFGKEHGLKRGDVILGFRIPSTELHSGVPVIIKGFIHSERKDNVIIISSQLTFLHGSDFDVDSLFCIYRKRSKTEWKSFDGERVLYSAQEPYNDEDMARLKAEFKSLTQKLGDGTVDKEVKAEIRKYLYGSMSSPKNSLVYHLNNSIENSVLADIIEVIRDPENRSAMMSPISLDRLNSESFGLQRLRRSSLTVSNTSKAPFIKPSNTEDKVKKAFSLFEKIMAWRGVDTVEGLYKTRWIHNALDYVRMHQDNFNGAKGTGVFANFTKGFNYLFVGTGNKDEMPKISSKYQFGLAGVEYNELSRFEKTKDKEGNVVVRMIPTKSGDLVPAKVGDTLDALVNASIDNVNEQILSVINVTSQTMNAWGGLLSVGVPLEQVGAIMQNPVAYLMNTVKGSSRKSIAYTKQRVIEAYGAIDGQEMSVEAFEALITADQLTEAQLEESIVKNPDEFFGLTGLTKDQLLIQYKILNLIEKGDAIAQEVGDAAKFANLAKTIPSAPWDQRELMRLARKYYKSSVDQHTVKLDDDSTKTYRTQKGLSKDKEQRYIRKRDEETRETSGVFTNVDLLNNVPHLRTAFGVLAKQVDRQSELFIRTNKFLLGMMRRIRNNYAAGLNFGKGIEHALEQMVQDFISFTISKSQIKDQSGAVVIDLNEDNQPPLYINEAANQIAQEVPEGTPGYIVIGGQQAWAVRFAMKLKELQGKVNNSFIRNLGISGDRVEDTQIKFNLAARLQPEDIAMYQKYFKDLFLDYPELMNQYGITQWDFVKYLLISNGANYGATTYATVIPSELFEPVDYAINKLVSNKLDEAMEASNQILESVVEVEQEIASLKELKADRLKIQKKLTGEAQKQAYKANEINPLTEQIKELTQIVKNRTAFAKNEGYLKVLTDAFYQYEEAFAIQLAINHADSIKNVDSTRIEKKDKAKRGIDELTNASGDKIEVYYDLRLKKYTEEEQVQEASKIAGDTDNQDQEEVEARLKAMLEGDLIIANYGTLYVRVDPPSDYNPEFLYYQEAGKAGKIKQYRKTTENFSIRKAFRYNIPVRVVKNPIGLTTFTDRSNAPLLKVGNVIGFRSYRDVGRTEVQFYHITNVNEKTRTYSLRADKTRNYSTTAEVLGTVESFGEENSDTILC